MSVYSSLLRPVLFRMEAEIAHNLAVSALAQTGQWPLMRKSLAGVFNYQHPSLSAQVAGLNFSNPVGLAAGFDKDCRLGDALPSLGFGFLELGTVTALPQTGNPKPRVFRLPLRHAIINCLGFNSAGAAVAAKHLSRLKSRSIPIGINIGINVGTAPEKAAEEYAWVFKELYAFADYFAINVSSPNTQGLRRLQDPAHLQDILRALAADNPKRKPVFVKLSPDLEEPSLKELVAVLESFASGVICTNTTISRPGLSPEEASLPGGLSGAPLSALSTRMIGKIHRLSPRLPIIGVGGIFSAQDAYEKIVAGASLVQIYTGIIYRGPGLVAEINKGLARLLKQEGLTGISQAVGMTYKTAQKKVQY